MWCLLINKVHVSLAIFFNSLAKPHLEALDSTIDEEEGELEEQEQEGGEEGQGELLVDEMIMMKTCTESS